MPLPISYAPQETSLGGNLGTALGTGISTGLQNLINLKLQEVQRQKQAQGLQQLLNLDPNAALGLAYQDPRIQQEYAKRKLLEPSQQAYLQLLQQQLGEPGAEGQQSQLPQNLTNAGITEHQATKLAELGFKKQELALAKQKAEQAGKLKLEPIIAQQDNLNEIIDTTDRMLKNLKSSDLKVGVLPSLQGQYAPTSLNTTSEQFDKDASRILNLASQNIRGIPTGFRVKLLKKEKPGLEHSVPVNKQIIERTNKEAKQKLKALKQRYPDAFKQQQMDMSELPPAMEYSDDSIIEAYNGQQFKKVGQNWEPING